MVNFKIAFDFFNRLFCSCLICKILFGLFLFDYMNPNLHLLAILKLYNVIAVSFFN